VDKKVYFEKLIQAADILDGNLKKLAAQNKNPISGADLEFKFALAYFVQNDLQTAGGHLAQAKRVLRKKATHPLFWDLLGYWEGLVAAGSDFELKSEEMDATLNYQFEVMFWYSVTIMQKLPRQYQEALLRVAGGDLSQLEDSEVREYADPDYPYFKAGFAEGDKGDE
jgi:hypothetical protein